MLISLSRPKSLPGRLLNVILIAYLIVGVSGCSNPPRTEKPPTSVARAMETRSFNGDLRTVLKASINSLQDMDYTIDVLNSDIGLISASRTTESRKASLTNEKPKNIMSDGEKACLAIGAVAIIALIAAAPVSPEVATTILIFKLYFSKILEYMFPIICIAISLNAKVGP